jgi:hypothetical protein
MASALKKYANAKLGIELSYPKTWHVNEMMEDNGLVQFAPSLDGLSSLNVTQLPASGETLEKVTSDILSQLTTFAQGVNSYDKPLANQPARWVEYPMPLPDGTRLNFIQAWTIFKGYAYIVTFSAPVSEFQVYQPFVSAVFASFRLIPIKKPLVHLTLKTYVNQKHGFKFKYPPTWVQTELSKVAAPTVFAVTFKHLLALEDEMIELEFLIVVDELSSSTTLDDYA